MDKEIVIFLLEIFAIIVIAAGIALYSILGLFMWSIPTAIIFVGVAIFYLTQGLDVYLSEHTNVPSEETSSNSNPWVFE